MKYTENTGIFLMVFKIIILITPTKETAKKPAVRDNKADISECVILTPSLYRVENDFTLPVSFNISISY
ncbi:hypothetical protein SDC9_212020 [bioreactor metagenome]|uniref:Uncharacterized protein n=1 Tax=bioreactor metagenome TaxID=1076179 RepID=A0A645JNB0_9ZZZZ